MVASGVFDPFFIHVDTPDHAEPGWQVPCVAIAMLQNVHLWREKTTPPIEHRGDFWYWKLSAYGLDLMRVLAKASQTPFSYSETFLEIDPTSIPQLVLLAEINSLIQSQLANANAALDWATVFNASSFLHDIAATIDLPVFLSEIDRLAAHIRAGHYDSTGARVAALLARANTQ